MTAEPKVSIVIPTYNQAAVLDRAIRSACAQTWRNLEVVVADDASTEDLGPVAARYRDDPRVRWCRGATNVGRAANYRRGLYDYATGDWALNLDGDDYLTDPTSVADAMARAAGSDVVLVVAGSRAERPGMPVRERRPTTHEWEVVDGTRFFWDWTPATAVPHLTSLYRRDVACALGFYRADILADDGESLRRLVLHGDVLLTGRIAGTWVGHGANASSSLDPARHLANLRQFTWPAAYALERGLDPQRLARWVDASVARYAEHFVDACLSYGRIEDALWYLREVRALHPRAAALAVRHLARNGPALGKLALGLVGGRKLVVAARGAVAKRRWAA